LIEEKKFMNEVELNKQVARQYLELIGKGDADAGKR